MNFQRLVEIIILGFVFKLVQSFSAPLGQDQFGFQKILRVVSVYIKQKDYCSNNITKSCRTLCKVVSFASFHHEFESHEPDFPIEF
jgi:hypothetical protein